ncbi:MAG: calcineurin-like phosphoesterase C-terminal domain-containing protein [Bacteroidales bacterium]|nr:calcineurin-like phosphoesterase C-terminal domain-containing protein [Candidatus Cacconaster merdequi]
MSTLRYLFAAVAALCLTFGTQALADDFHVSGTVLYDDGAPAAGVAVSDGFRVAVTDSEGHYSMAVCPDSRYIFVSCPADAVISKNESGIPDFYRDYTASQSVYDFTLKRCAKEKVFSLFAMADPQAHGMKVDGQDVLQTVRFRTESVPAVNRRIAGSTVPCYGVMLGDIVYSEDERNSTVDMPYMRESVKMIGMPVFQVMGNHDYTYCFTDCPLKEDDAHSTINLQAQSAFAENFGPIDFSFNRGDAHIVCMKDIIFEDPSDATHYHGGFTTSQYMWLKADLAAVPVEKMVILCVHIPLTDFCTKENTYGPQVVELLKQYPNVHILSGHMHYMKNITEKESPVGIYEHIHAALCGQWWWSNLNGDGSPNGYSVYTFSGNRLSDSYYVGVNEGMDDRSYQMRLYRGNELTGGDFEKFSWNVADNTLIANVFNADANWVLNVYEDGVLSGTMARVPFSNVRVPYVEGQVTLAPEGSSKDWWTIGYHTGVLGWSHVMGGRYQCNGFHLYEYELKNPLASVKVEAIDPFGNRYECSCISSGTDYPDWIRKP